VAKGRAAFLAVVAAGLVMGSTGERRAPLQGCLATPAHRVRSPIEQAEREENIAD
jgi:hypothetical protein